MVGKCMHVGAKEPLRDSLNPSPWRDLLDHISCKTQQVANKKHNMHVHGPWAFSDPSHQVHATKSQPLAGPFRTYHAKSLDLTDERLLVRACFVASASPLLVSGRFSPQPWLARQAAT